MGPKPGDVVTVTVSFTVLDVCNVDDVGGLIQLNIAPSLQWYDPRLNFVNLVDNIEMNALRRDEMASIWYPAVFFQNKEPNFRELEEIISPSVTMIANSSTISPMSELYTASIAGGSENPLVWRSQIK